MCGAVTIINLLKRYNILERDCLLLLYKAAKSLPVYWISCEILQALEMLRNSSIFQIFEGFSSKIPGIFHYFFKSDFQVLFNVNLTNIHWLVGQWIDEL